MRSSNLFTFSMNLSRCLAASSIFFSMERRAALLPSVRESAAEVALSDDTEAKRGEPRAAPGTGKDDGAGKERGRAGYDSEARGEERKGEKEGRVEYSLSRHDFALIFGNLVGVERRQRWGGVWLAVGSVGSLWCSVLWQCIARSHDSSMY